MSFSPKEIGLGIVVLLLTVGLTRYFTPEKIKYETAEQSKKLDSLTTLTQALRVDKSQIKDSLANTSKAFRDYVDKNKDKLASYNKIIGKLNLKVDSLQEVSSLSIWDLKNDSDSTEQTFADTTLEKRATFGNGLIEAVARGGIRNDSLFLDTPEISQLRRVRIDQAIFINDDRSSVKALTTSPDFDSLKVVSTTPLKPKGRRFPWTEVATVAAFILGYAL